MCWFGLCLVFRVRVGLVFGFACAGFAADLGVSVSGSGTVRVGAAKGPTFASALVVDGRYLCSCVRVRACESRVSTGCQVDSGVWT